MFGIGGGEFVAIALLAAVLVGPQSPQSGSRRYKRFT